MNIFETIILISMASLGFRCITDKGMIFYFLRGWLDRLKEVERVNKEEKQLLLDELLDVNYSLNLLDKKPDSWTLKGIQYFKKHDIEHWSDAKKSIEKDLSKMKSYRIISIILYLAKPVILCGTCMSSVHTLIWWPILVGEYTLFTIVTMLSVAFLNTLLYLIIEKLQGK